MSWLVFVFITFIKEEEKYYVVPVPNSPTHYFSSIEECEYSINYIKDYIKSLEKRHGEGIVAICATQKGEK